MSNSNLMRNIEMRTIPLLALTFVSVIWLSPCLHRATADTFGLGDNAFEIEFVTIGYAGNSPDLENRPNSYQGPPEKPIPIGDVDYV